MLLFLGGFRNLTSNLISINDNGSNLKLFSLVIFFSISEILG